MKWILIFSLIFLQINPVFSKGDLTRQKPVEVRVNLLGKTGKTHFFSPPEIKLETGILYRLVIINKSENKHYFTSMKFANSVYTRKIQVVNDKKKIAEVNGNIKEVEVFPGYSVEWWLIPIKTGIFDDLHCSVIDEVSKKSHKDMGMTGKIIVY